MSMSYEQAIEMRTKQMLDIMVAIPLAQYDALVVARAELIERCVKIVAAQPYYPDTKIGMRQQWVKDQIEKAIRDLGTTPTELENVRFRTLLIKARNLLNMADTYTELSCGETVREIDAALRAAGVDTTAPE